MTDRPSMLRFPSFDSLQFFSERFKEVDVSATEAFIATLRLSLQFVSETETYLATRDLSHARFMVLMILMRADGKKVTPGELAKELNVTPATITGIIDTLVNQTWVGRRPDPDDRRSVMVELTAAGRKKLTEMLPSHYKMIAELMAPFSEVERQAMKTLMTRFGSAMASMSQILTTQSPTKPRK